jgi:hypothetical protein
MTLPPSFSCNPSPRIGMALLSNDTITLRKSSSSLAIASALRSENIVVHRATRWSERPACRRQASRECGSYLPGWFRRDRSARSARSHRRSPLTGSTWNSLSANPTFDFFERGQSRGRGGCPVRENQIRQMRSRCTWRARSLQRSSQWFLQLSPCIRFVLFAQPPAGMLRHAYAHRGGPDEICSEQGPEGNGSVPRQRTRLENGMAVIGRKLRPVKIAQQLTQRGNTGIELLSASPTRPAAIACTEVMP